MTNILKHRTKN